MAPWATYLKARLRPVVYNLLTPVFVYGLKPVVLQIEWNSLQKIPALAVPILFLSGKKDELIPPTQMHQLYVRCVGKAFDHASSNHYNEGAEVA